MRKFFKRFFIGLGIFIILLLAAAIILPIVYKDKILNFAKTEVNKQINAKIDFNNDISLTLFSSFPDFTLGVKDLKVINKAPFEGDTLVSIGELKTTIDIMSVIKGGKMTIKSFTLDKPNIHVIVNHDGIPNWDITIKNKDSVAKAGGDTTSNFKMALNHYGISNGKVIYDDQQMGMYTRMDNLNHTGSGDFTSDVFDLDTKTNIDELTFRFGGIDYLHKVKTMLKLTMNMDMKQFKFTFKDNELDLNDLALGMDGWLAMPKSDIDMDLKFNAKKTEFKNIISLIPAIYTSDFKDLKSSGTFALEGSAKGIYNDKTYPAFNVMMKIANGMFQYPALPASVSDVNVDTKVSSPGGSLDNMIVDISKAHMNFGGDPFDAHMNITHPMTDPYIDGAIQGKIILDKVKNMVKLDKGTNLAGTIDMNVVLKGAMSAVEKQHYDQFNASGYMSGKDIIYESADMPQTVKMSSMRLDFSPQLVKLSNMNMNIGKSDLQAEGDLSNFLGYMFKNETIKGSLNITSAMMDLNPFMSSSTTATKTPDTAKAKPMDVIAIPGNIDFTMKASMGRILYDIYDITNLKGSLHVHDKKLDMNDIAMNMLGSQISMDGSYDTKNAEKPRVDINKMSIKQLDIPTAYKSFVTVQKFASIAKYLKGKMDISMDLHTDLDKHMMPVMNSVMSDGVLNIDHAELSGFAPQTAIADKLKLQQFNNLAINKIHPSYNISNGRFSLKEPVKFNIDKTNCSLIGSSGLDQTIDYKLETDIPAAQAKDQAASTLDGLFKQKNLPMPANKTINVLAKITGTTTSPKVSLELGSLTADIVNSVKDQANAAKKEALDKLNVEKDKALKAAQDKANAEKQKVLDQADQLKKQKEDELRKQEDAAKQKAKDEADKKKNDLQNQGKDLLKKQKLPFGK